MLDQILPIAIVVVAALFSFVINYKPLSSEEEDQTLD